MNELDVAKLSTRLARSVLSTVRAAREREAYDDALAELAASGPAGGTPARAQRRGRPLRAGLRRRYAADPLAEYEVELARAAKHRPGG